MSSTILEVAERAGVSAMTVSRFFNAPDKLSPATYARVKKAVEALSYVPNAAARTLLRGSSHTLALILTDITNPFFTTLARGVEDEACAHGYTLILGNTDEERAREEAYLTMIASRRVDGALLTPTFGDAHRVNGLLDRNLPVVLVDRRIPGARADCVHGDAYGGGRMLAEHLVARGYRDVAFVGGDARLSSLQDRLAGYRDVMRALGLPERVYPGRYDRESGREILDGLVDDGALPEAILAANNFVAVGVLMALQRHGLSVPGDVALACFDDFEVASFLDPFMTVAVQPAYEIGRAAMQLLLERIGGSQAPPRIQTFPFELVVRRSTPPRQP